MCEGWWAESAWPGWMYTHIQLMSEGVGVLFQLEGVEHA